MQERSKLRDPLPQDPVQQPEVPAVLPEARNIPLRLPDPQTHPTGGRRTVGKQAPRLIVEDVDDTTDVQMDVDEQTVHDAPSMASNDILDDMDVQSNVDMLDIWLALTHPPEEDLWRSSLRGVMFPYYVPCKGEEFDSSPYMSCVGRRCI